MVPLCALLSGLSHLPAQDTHFLGEEGQKGDERRGWTSRAKGWVQADEGGRQLLKSENDYGKPEINAGGQGREKKKKKNTPSCNLALSGLSLVGLEPVEDGRKAGSGK